MDTKFEKLNATEAYEKPSMQVFEMEIENALMQGASGEGKPGHGYGDGGHTGPPGQNKKDATDTQTMPRHTRYYMGESDYDSE